MNSKLNWKKGIIYLNDQPIGDFVRDKVLTCQYKLNESMLNFEELDLYKRQIAIMDSDRNRLGIIRKKRWSKKAKITLTDDREFELKPVNFWSKKWKLYADQNELMVFNKGIFNKGEVNYIFQDEVLILSGLYVVNN